MCKPTTFGRDIGALKYLYARVASNLMQSIKMRTLHICIPVHKTETVEIGTKIVV